MTSQVGAEWAAVFGSILFSENGNGWWAHLFHFYYSLTRIFLHTFYEWFLCIFLRKDKWAKSINSLLIEVTCDWPINKDQLLSVNKNMQIKAARYYFKPLGWAKINSPDNTKCLEEPWILYPSSGVYIVATSLYSYLAVSN